MSKRENQFAQDALVWAFWLLVCAVTVGLIVWTMVE